MIDTSKMSTHRLGRSRKHYVSGYTTSYPMATTTVRLPDRLLDALDEMADQEHVDRSTIIRQAIERGLEDLSLDQAIERYQRGGVSAWQAARSSGVSLSRFLDEMSRRGLGIRTDEDLLADQIEGLE